MADVSAVAVAPDRRRSGTVRGRRSGIVPGCSGGLVVRRSGNIVDRLSGARRLSSGR